MGAHCSELEREKLGFRGVPFFELWPWACMNDLISS